VIRNVAGLVYLGKLTFSCTQIDIDLTMCAAMADTVCIRELYENGIRSHEVGIDEHGPGHILPGDGP